MMELLKAMTPDIHKESIYKQKNKK